MKWALIDPNGQVINIIIYDGVSEFQAPGGVTLLQVNDWINIGDNKNDPKPVPPSVTP